MLALELFEELQGPPEPTLIDALRDFLPIALKHLKLKSLPKITFVRDVEDSHVPTFGRYSNDEKVIFVDIENRHPNDIIRTLAHELTHFAQGEHGELDVGSWQTGSPVENDANAQAGVIMRKFNTEFPQYLKLKPVVFESVEGSEAEAEEEEEREESDPTKPIPFPKGTTLVNVSDVYDWYKLGMAVPALDKADPRIFHKGVPHTVFAFGSEEEEHKMIPLLKRLGFTLHDIDDQDDYQQAIRASDVVEHLEKYVAEKWSKKYKKSINCSNPKGFSQKAHCAARRARQAGKKTKSKSVSESVDVNYGIGKNPGKLVKVGPQGQVPHAKLHVNVNKSTAKRLGIPHVSEAEDRCPPATQDIALNLKNRQKAIDEYGYGPLNPLEPNVKFWAKKQEMWQLDSIDDAKKSLCGNCAAFDQTKHTLDCIAKGIGDDSGSEDPHDVIDAGDLGYCRFLKFKCASLRTCDAWVVGGPITEGKHCNVKNAVPELRAALEKRKSELKVADADTAYDKIDKIMTRIAKTYNITGQELHDLWTERYGEIPDTWVLDEGKITNTALVALLASTLASQPAFSEPSAIAKAIGIARTINNMKGYGPDAAQAEAQQELMNLIRALGNQGNNNSKVYPLIKDMVKTPGPLPTTVQELPPLMDEPTNENFADGKGPGRPGDSQRHGIPKGATMAQLEKAAKAPGRKGQLARWQLNMRRGKKK